MAVSLVLLLLSVDVCVAFTFEASMLYGRWHVNWNVSAGFGRTLSVEWCSEEVLCNVSLTKGFLSQSVVEFLLSASIVILRIMFWSTCTLCMSMFDAEFHLAQAYCQIGLMHVK